jgi:hypothetical protein
MRENVCDRGRRGGTERTNEQAAQPQASACTAEALSVIDLTLHISYIIDFNMFGCVINVIVMIIIVPIFFIFYFFLFFFSFFIHLNHITPSHTQ